MEFAFETRRDDRAPAVLGMGQIKQRAKATTDERAREMFNADTDGAVLPTIANFVECWLEHVETDIFDRNKRHRFFNDLGRRACVEPNQGVDDVVPKTRHPLAIVDTIVLMRVVDRLSGVANRKRSRLMKEMDGLTDRDALIGLIFQPRNRSNVSFGIEALVPVGPCRRRKPVTPLPSPECISRHPGALDDRSRVIYWVCSQMAEQCHVTDTSFAYYRLLPTVCL